MLAGCDLTPPLVGLAQVLGWQQVPLSVREARRRVLAEGLLPSPPPPDPEPAGAPVLVARGVGVRYGEVAAVNGVDLTLRRGEVTTLLGRNGSGKSSLLWALQGALSHSGEVRVADQDPSALPAAQARRLVSLVPQTAADLLYLSSVGRRV